MGLELTTFSYVEERFLRKEMCETFLKNHK